jgi:methyl-accepting chemotaxis protein
MKLKLKIRHKIQLFILLTTFVIYSLAVGYISIKSKNMAFEDATQISDNYVKGAARKVEIYLEKYLTTVENLSHTFTSYQQMREKSRRDVIGNMMINTLKSNPDFLAVWSTWEPNSIDSLDSLYAGKKGSTVIGNFGRMYYKNNGQIIFDKSVESNADEIYSGNYYQIPKKTKKPIILDPYYYSYTDSEADKTHETSIVAPIMSNNRFLGVVGADIKLDQFQKIIEQVKPYKNSIAFLMSNNGTYVANPSKEFIGKKVNEVFPEEAEEHKIMEHIEKGKFLSYTVEGLDGSLYYDVYAPIDIGNTGKPWSIGVAVPIEHVMAKATRSFWISILVGIVGLLILSLVIYYISNSITKPVLKITDYLKKLSQGHIGDDMYINIDSGDEIEEMGEALNKSISGLLEKTKFAKDIGNGNYDTSFELLSEHDILGKSLIDMRDKLKKAREEEEERKKEEEKRRWANEGLARFSDILRQNHENINELAYAVVRNLIKYLEANQGGLFIKNDENEEDVYYELAAAYAYNRRKYQVKEFRLGEGLIGTCAVEQKTIYMTDLPDSYIEITSGLGDANPNSLLIVPLMVEDDVLGVVEIASFNTFEKYEIEFVERIAQNIASTLASTRTNERTAQLLEKTQQQAEEMSSQEEEMRQNMEELKATQEEAARKSSEMEGYIKALNSTSYVAEYDTNGKIIYVNDAYLELFNISRDEATGKHHSDNIDFTKEQKEHYEKFWEDLLNGKIKKQKTQVTIKGKTFVFMESYTPIYDEEGNIKKIIKIANDISDYEKKE